MFSKAQKLVEKFLKEAKNPLLVIVGATASGKTGLSIELAKQFQGEIISADSRQIYRYLDVGTAKVTEKEKQGIPHFGIDLCEPEETFSVAQYKAYALEKIKDIFKRQKLPILVGGTGLYVNALTQDFSLPKVPPDRELRERLEKMTTMELHQKLQEIDPEEAAKIHPNNRRYVIRAIEIAEKTGQKKSALMQKKAAEFEVLILGIEIPRELLYKRINQRVEEMLQNGWREEIQALLVAGYDFGKTAFNSVGYREIKAFQEGKLTYPEMVELIQKNTRNYAKRQLTWWRSDERVQWLEQV